MTLYTSKVVAMWLCVTERRVRQLRDEGAIEEKQPGLYDLQQTVARYIAYLRKGNKADLNDERAMLTRAKRDAVEMENALRRQTMHSTGDIEKGIKTMCLNIRRNFLALPAKLSPELAGGDRTQAEVFDRLKAAIDETLETLRDFNVSFAQVPDGEERAEDAGAGDV